jgi:hypothetical protein
MDVSHCSECDPCPPRVCPCACVPPTRRIRRKLEAKAVMFHLRSRRMKFLAEQRQQVRSKVAISRARSATVTDFRRLPTAAPMASSLSLASSAAMEVVPSTGKLNFFFGGVGQSGSHFCDSLCC